MKIINRIFLSSLIIMQVSCFNNKRVLNNSNIFVAKINDSINVSLSYDEKTGNIKSIIIDNNKSKLSSIYGFYGDGITPVLIGNEKEGKRTGKFYSFYSSGRLNLEVDYLNGKYNGYYNVFSEDGELVYKAIYKEGEEDSVILKTQEIDEKIEIIIEDD